MTESMDARLPWSTGEVAVPLRSSRCCGASFRSVNFAVEAATRDIAERVAVRAEACRTAIAKAWLGHELPNWTTPCPVRVRLTAKARPAA